MPSDVTMISDIGGKNTYLRNIKGKILWSTFEIAQILKCATSSSIVILIHQVDSLQKLMVSNSRSIGTYNSMENHTKHEKKVEKCT